MYHGIYYKTKLFSINQDFVRMYCLTLNRFLKYLFIFTFITPYRIKKIMLPQFVCLIWSHIVYCPDLITVLRLANTCYSGSHRSSVSRPIYLNNPASGNVVINSPIRQIAKKTTKKKRVFESDIHATFLMH